MAVATLFLAGAAACARDDDHDAGAGSRGPVATAARAGEVERRAARPPFAGFAEITVVVVDADGVEHRWCLLLADTPALQSQGLMEIVDPALGGYDGMLFAFGEDEHGGFWMKNTRLPLSIAFLRADGTTVSTTDMVPCPDDARSCPTYPSGGAYRYAVEVPQGGLDRLGIGDRSTVRVGDAGCHTT